MTFDRRRFLRAAAAAALAPVLPGWARDAVAGTAGATPMLWYDTPAGPWVEALPVGNGRLGAMVFGRPAQERVQFNIDTLYAAAFTRRTTRSSATRCRRCAR